MIKAVVHKEAAANAVETAKHAQIMLTIAHLVAD